MINDFSKPWLGALALVASCSAWANPQYRVTAIELPSAPSSVTPVGINRHGQVALTSEQSPNGSSQAYVWSALTGLTALPLSTGYARVNGINDAGLVVGYADGAVFTWDTATGSALLHRQGALAQSQVYALNQRGDFAGMTDKSGRWVAASWQGGSRQELGVLLQNVNIGFDMARAINDSGMIAGGARSQISWNEHAFVYTPEGGMVDIGTLYGENDFSTAHGINDFGQVVGWSRRSGQAAQRAFVWSAQGGMQDLGHLFPGYSQEYVYAYDINNQGLVVGGTSSFGRYHGFLWNQTSGLQKLDDLVDNTGRATPWQINSAFAINEAGQIVGSAMLDGRTIAVLLTPVPEPSSFALLLGGLGLFGWRLRRHGSIPASL